MLRSREIRAIHVVLRMIGFFVFLPLAVPLSGASVSAPFSSPLDTYTERTWQMQDGLPEQIVQAFAQTADRYLWIGTTGGLLRFDGERFVLYNRENTPAFRDNNIFCLTVSRDNTLWIGTEGGGLIRYRGGVFHPISDGEGLTNAFVRSVHEDANGRMWVGTDDGLFRLAGERFERMDGRNGVPAVAVHAIYEDRSHRLWVGGSRLLSLGGSEAVEYRLPGEGSQNRVKSIVETSDGTMWVGTVSGLERMQRAAASGKRFERVREVSGTIRFLRETSDGRLWIGTIGHGLQICSQGRFFRVTAPQRLPSNTVLNLFEDAERNIWVGTQAGMLRLSETPVRTVSLPDAPDSDAETVYQDVDGDVWIAAANLFRSHNGKTTAVRFAGLAGVRVRNVFRDREGTLWIGTEGRGVYHQVGGQLIHYTTTEGLVNNFIRAFLQSRDGSVWIATDEGVSRWTEHHFVNYQMSNGLCYFSTRSLLQDRDGDIWIGTDHGVSRLHGDTFVTDEAVRALQEEKVWAIHQDPEGGLWFGTRTGGLYQWRSGRLRHSTVAQGLASNSVYELIEDHNGNFWASGPNGISVINRHELESVTAQPGRRVRVTLYGISEGLETIQMCGGEKPAGILTRAGEVWFPSSKGPVRVSVAQPQPSEPAPVVIDQVMVDGLQIPSGVQVSLNPNATKLELHFGVVLLRSQERMRFRYMLDGFDRDWSEASASRVAYYTNLPPGKYRFRVVAYEMNDPDRVVESSVGIAQDPHFYRTPWFTSFCVLILAALAWSTYQFRLGQLRARFQAGLKERNRLAREMHDTLIQGCVSVSALLEAHSSLGVSDAEARHDLLECARTEMRSTIDEARQAVFDLRLTPQSLTDIGPLVSGMAERISREFGIPVECRTSGKPFHFEQLVVHELLMVTREAIYNAVRHGEPTRVSVSIHFDENRCIVNVNDDGSGFDPDIVSRLPAGHYGLTGMKERMDRMGASLTLKSRAGAGTELLIEIPRKLVDSHHGAGHVSL